jgi:hypothetical protein
MSRQLRHRLDTFLAPFLRELDQQIDARLVRTFRATIEVLLVYRHRALGLLLSELGGWLLSPAQAPAGTKRLSNLLRSPKWQAALLTRFLWQLADARCQELTAAGATPLVLWDESVLEKPESRRGDGLGPVRSSKAARLTRPKPGCFRKPSAPVVVPGLHWLSLLLVGPSGPPTVAVMRWFSLPRRPKPGAPPLADPLPPGCAPDLRTLQGELLRQCARAWGRRVLHVWDRGYAGSPWLGQVLPLGVRFVLRWCKSYQLTDAAGKTRPAWQIPRGKRAWGHRRCWDPRTRQYRQVGVLAFRVTHPEYPDHPLWLVVGRYRGKAEPWYLLTNEPIHTLTDAWQVVFAYRRRWQIELTFRYGKSELALESPRVWQWEGREKLLLMVTLAYAFLLQLLTRTVADLRQWLLRHYCHRTGKRAQAAIQPLYRLRAALSRLWQECPATLAPAVLENSG